MSNKGGQTFMKKFIAGLLFGIILCGAVGAATLYEAQPATFKVMVNGKEFNSDPPALVGEGRTYLPLRAMGEALGVPINWNQELNQAEVGNQAAVADTNQYSRNNPAPLDTVQIYTKENKYSDDDYTISMRILETVRGEKAMKMLIEANMFNDEPQEGYEYVLAKVSVSALNVENDGAFTLNDYDFTAFSSNNEEMPQEFVVEPEPAFEGKIYAGGNAEGWICVLVRKNDSNPKLAYGLDYDGRGGIWFALQ